MVGRNAVPGTGGDGLPEVGVPRVAPPTGVKVALPLEVGDTLAVRDTVT